MLFIYNLNVTLKVKLNFKTCHKETTCLRERNLLRRINDFDWIFKCQKNDPFLKEIIIGDEKWVVSQNVERKRSTNPNYFNS